VTVFFNYWAGRPGFHSL